MRPPSIESLDRLIKSFQSKPEHFLEYHSDILDGLMRKRTLLEQFQKDYFGPGYTLKHHDSDCWRVVLADTAEPGRFRWLEFDVRGFVGHHTYDTPEECLGDMVDSRFEIPDHNVLDGLTDTPEWRKGTAITAVIQESNNRLITWEKALERIQSIQAAYELEVA